MLEYTCDKLNKFCFHLDSPSEAVNSKMCRWVYEGVIDDPHDEFFIAEDKSLQKVWRWSSWRALHCWEQTSSRFLTACFIIGESHPRLRCYVLETAVQSQRWYSFLPCKFSGNHFNNREISKCHERMWAQCSGEFATSH